MPEGDVCWLANPQDPTGKARPAVVVGEDRSVKLALVIYGTTTPPRGPTGDMAAVVVIEPGTQRARSMGLTATTYFRATNVGVRSLPDARQKAGSAPLAVRIDLRIVARDALAAFFEEAARRAGLPKSRE